MTREQKIEKLRNLISGKITLKDLQPYKCYVWEHFDEYFTLEDGSLKLTEEEFNQFTKDHGTHHIILEDYSNPH